MTRKALEAFDLSKLPKGKGKGFEVRNPETGYGEFHYFYRSHSGEVFQVVTRNMNKAIELRNEWLASEDRAKYQSYIPEEYCELHHLDYLHGDECPRCKMLNAESQLMKEPQP